LSVRAGVAAAVRLAAAGVSVTLAVTATAAAQQPAPTPPAVIDGPSGSIVLPSGLAVAVARDGTGGVVYLKRVAGAAHVFVAPLLGGSFGAPLPLDAWLPGGSAQPVIAAGNDGLLIVAFVSGGELYAVWRTSATAPFNVRALAAGASNPAISITSVGKAYLVFTVADGGGHDVRAAYYFNGRWGVESAPLNATPADDAGVGSGPPEVAAAGDGIGIVVWGERGGVYSRRVWGTSPSVVYERADGPLPGCDEVSADHPVVGTEGDSSYADVAFHELLSCGGGQQSRVLLDRLTASVYTGIVPVDGLSAGGSGGAVDPQIAMGEYGTGLVTSERVTTNDAYVTTLAGSGVVGPTSQLNGEPDATVPDPVPATAGLYSSLVAWQQAPAPSGIAGVVVRYTPAGAGLGPELPVSSAAPGVADAQDGLAAGGDGAGDALVAWVQSTPAGPALLAARLYQPPGAVAAIHRFQYQRTAHPRLAWAPAREAWGPVTYTVALDGVSVGETTATSLTVPVVVGDGPHRWQVTATNPAGQQSTMRPAEVFVDTVPPDLTASAPARVPLAKAVKLHVRYRDPAPPGEPVADASGVAAIVVRWGDGSITRLPAGRHFAVHVYRRARRYTLRITVFDAAGNSTTAVRRILVRAPRRRGARKPGAGGRA
jgi:hypothetical protein